MLNEKVECLECGKMFKRIDFHLKSHNLTFDDLKVVWESEIDLKALKDYIKGEFYEN